MDQARIEEGLAGGISPDTSTAVQGRVVRPLRCLQPVPPSLASCHPPALSYSWKRVPDTKRDQRGTVEIRRRSQCQTPKARDAGALQGHGGTQGAREEQAGYAGRYAGPNRVRRGYGLVWRVTKERLPSDLTPLSCKPGSLPYPDHSYDRRHYVHFAIYIWHIDECL